MGMELNGNRKYNRKEKTVNIIEKTDMFFNLIWSAYASVFTFTRSVKENSHHFDSKSSWDKWIM